MDWKQLLASITGSVDEELRRRNEYLAVENRILRNQIKGRRVQLTDAERKTLTEMGQKLGRQVLAEIATITKPDTILAWHRTFAPQTCDRSPQRKAPGCPKIDQELEALVVRMAHENRSWGYDRIVGALANLGYTISDQTVGNILKRHGIPPAPERKTTTTWREFIRIHMDLLVATDFFTSEVWTWCGLVISSIFFFIHFGHRQGHVADLIPRVNAQWMLPIPRRFLDRHANVERGVGSGKQAGLSRLILFGEGIPRHLLSEFATYDHREGLPQGMGKVVPMAVVNHRPIRDGPMRCRQRLGRLLKDDHREAA